MPDPDDRSSARPWYEVAFGPLYPLLYRHRDDVAAAREAAFGIRVLGLRPPMRVLDLACGAGRHHRALRAAGLRAVGIDLSWTLLAEARSLGSNSIARGDMRRLPFADGAFDAVLSFFTSFGYFEDADDDRQALREVARVLDRRGRYLLDFLDAAHVERHLVPRSERSVPGYRLVEERRIEGGRVRKRVTIEADGATAPVSYEEVVTLYPRRDLERLLDEAAFEVEGAFGSFDGRPAGGGDRVIFAARKR